MTGAAGLAAHVVPTARADEGMWTPNAFPKDRVKARYGFAPDDKWLEHARLASVRMAGGCSASFVSPMGLVMTNHHCASSCVQALSTAKRDLVRQGYTARSAAEELACPDTELNQLVQIDDVTARLAAVTAGKTDQQAHDARRAEIAKIEKECVDARPKTIAATATGPGADWRCDVVSLFQGGRYDLYTYKRWKDARLVFAPEAAIAGFGGDPDNFMFPRYDLDVAFIRAYENGRPAPSEHFFKWSATGPKDGGLVFVAGHPGSTQRLLTVAQLEYLRDTQLPAFLRALAELRGLLTEFSRRSAEHRRTAAGTLAGVENSYKRAIGQFQTLLDRKVFADKVAAEDALRKKVDKLPIAASTGGGKVSKADKKAFLGAFDDIARAQIELRRVRVPYQMLERAGGMNSALFRIARDLVRGVEERDKPDGTRLKEYRDSALGSLQQRLFSPAPIYPDLDQTLLFHSLTKLREQLGPDHPVVRKVLGRDTPDDLARALVGGSRLGDVAVRRKLWDGGKAALDASTDPLIRLARLVDADARAVRKEYEDKVEAPESRAAELVARARFLALGQGTYPDATFTLRFSYGAVRGYDVDGERAPAMTRMADTFARATGAEPFALPRSWLDAQGKLGADVPMDMIYDTDTIGGNSGSPVVDQNAELVGINFDSNIFALGRAFVYEAAKGRSVGVTSSAIVEALRVVYGADRLLEELGR